jgi:hypothetical protein
MSEHTAGNNPVAAGTKIKSAWMEYVEDSLDSSLVRGGNVFKAYRTTTDQSLTNGVATTLLFNGVTFDVDSLYNSTTGIFSTAAGYYYLYAQATINGLTVGKVATLSIFSSGTGDMATNQLLTPADSEYGFILPVQGVFYTGVPVSVTVKLSLPAGADVVTLVTGQNYSFFTGFRVR